MLSSPPAQTLVFKESSIRPYPTCDLVWSLFLSNPTPGRIVASGHGPSGTWPGAVILPLEYDAVPPGTWSGAIYHSNPTPDRTLASGHVPPGAWSVGIIHAPPPSWKEVVFGHVPVFHLGPDQVLSSTTTPQLEGR